jgi:hypothetical protein
VTTRTVKAGGELFTTYGCSSWLDALHDGGECEYTDSVHTVVRETSKDLFVAMQAARQKYLHQEVTLQNDFVKLL